MKETYKSQKNTNKWKMNIMVNISKKINLTEEMIYAELYKMDRKKKELDE